MKGFIEVITTMTYPNRTLINLKDIKAIYEHQEKTIIGQEKVIVNTIIEGIFKLSDVPFFRCIETYEEIKKKIEQAQGEKQMTIAEALFGCVVVVCITVIILFYMIFLS